MTYDVQTPTAARLWPYGPDWGRGFDVRRAFLTDIVPTRNGMEQRRSVRPLPRLSAAYRTVVSGDQRRAADHHMRMWQNKPVAVPDFSRWAQLTGSSSGGSSELTVSPMPAWVGEDQVLVLCGEGVEPEQVVVESVAGTTITLADPLADAWPSGSVLRPTFFGLFDARIASQRLNRDVAAIDVSVAAYPGGEPPRAAGTAWATFGAYEVMTLQPDYAGGVSMPWLWPVDQVDFERGRTAQFRPIERLMRQLEAEFNGQDVTATTEIEQFFDRMKGRRNAFYMPTWERDLVLAATAGSGTSSLLVVGTDAAELDDFAAIAVCLTDGTQLYRTISAAIVSGGNTQLTVSSAWPVALTASNVARISWMPLWRFASDEMTSSWRTPLAANVRLTFQQVPE